MKSNIFKNLSKQQKAILTVIKTRPEHLLYCPSKYIKTQLKIGKSKSAANSFSRSLRNLRNKGIIERLGNTRFYRIMGEKDPFYDTIPTINDLIEKLGIKEFDMDELKEFDVNNLKEIEDL